ncbi:MAG: extracellular solute-binding protein [Clostridia bacterium]|nr:extracellular solute-binding protein [Clostridia bacterium]
MKKNISALLLAALLVSMLTLPGGALADKPRLTVAGEADQAMPEGYGTVEENQWIDWIRENGPADIEVIAISEDNDLERYSMPMASGTAPDIIYSGDPVTMNTLINQRLLMPLDDVIDQYSVEYKKRLEEYPFLRDLGSVDGKLYLLGAPSPAIMPEQVRFIRVDWLEKLGLEMPTTVDEYLEVARAFAKNDPDGNGVDDTYGTNLSGKGSVMIDWMFGDARWFIRDGKMVMDLTPSMQASLFKKALFDEGIVDRDYLIDSHYADPDLSLAAVADMLGMNPNYVSTLIKDETGMTFTRMVNRKRIDEAEERLLHTSMQISVVAEATGFQSAVSFNRVFKQTTGMTPGEFRKNGQRQSLQREPDDQP